MKLENVTLRGDTVTLRPMSLADLDELTEVGLEPSIWDFTPSRITDRDGMQRYVEEALKDKESGTALPFVTTLTESDKIIGSTRFGNIDVANRRAEIGWTWVVPARQRTNVNTEAKLLMLTHAFETWKCLRVEFKTDSTNIKSRNAILRLGAVEEGIFRQHMITETGRLRDSVYFSILDSEWNSVRDRLEEKLKNHK